jgi:hypothetical protein
MARDMFRDQTSQATDFLIAFMTPHDADDHQSTTHHNQRPQKCTQHILLIKNLSRKLYLKLLSSWRVKHDFTALFKCIKGRRNQEQKKFKERKNAKWITDRHWLCTNILGDVVCLRIGKVEVLTGPTIANIVVPGTGLDSYYWQREQRMITARHGKACSRN